MNLCQTLQDVNADALILAYHLEILFTNGVNNNGPKQQRRHLRVSTVLILLQVIWGYVQKKGLIVQCAICIILFLVEKKKCLII